MGVAKNMKRKFSLTNLRLKTSIPSDTPEADYDTDSPPYSPTLSEMERRSLDPQLTQTLRQACAVLVAMTNPPDPDDEALDQLVALKKFEAERKAQYVPQVRTADAKSMNANPRTIKKEKVVPEIEEQPKKEQPRRYSTRRPRQDSNEPFGKDKPPHYVPKDSMGRSRALETHHNPSDQSHPTITEPLLPPVHAPIVERTLQHQHVDFQALGHIRSSMHLRPKTSAAACIDYEGGPTTNSSNSTSCSNSDYAAIHAHRTSTGLTSLQALTPTRDGGRTSRKGRRPSEGASYSSSMEEEMQELARRRADEYVAKHGQRPPSRTSKLSRVSSHSDLGKGRSGSRAGSLASSIADGISNYIRPRGSSNSMDGMRSGASSSLGFSRSQSRSSSRSRESSFSSAGGWWRNGGLRRRGSWASFRSGGTNGEGKERNRLRKNGQPNLNRPLPALPGLDQYKETKTHIGQLVKSNAKRKVKKNKIGIPQPLLPPDTPYTATLPQHSPSNLNLSYHAASAPLPDEDGVEKEFPRLPNKQREPVERRSTHPETVAKTEKAHGRLRRSSLNPVKPRRDSANANTSASQLKKMPPPIIRGPSYKRELEVGVYPRRMEVNDGACHVNFYDSQQNQSITGDPDGDAGEWERKCKLKERMGKMLCAKEDGRRVVAAM
ncbi:MAG: hypothetical protein Q9217_002800 [Psora testacea]